MRRICKLAGRWLGFESENERKRRLAQPGAKRVIEKLKEEGAVIL